MKENEIFSEMNTLATRVNITQYEVMIYQGWGWSLDGYRKIFCYPKRKSKRHLTAQFESSSNIIFYYLIIRLFIKALRKRRNCPKRIRSLRHVTKRKI